MREREGEKGCMYREGGGGGKRERDKEKMTASPKDEEKLKTLSNLMADYQIKSIHNGRLMNKAEEDQRCSAALHVSARSGPRSSRNVRT